MPDPENKDWPEVVLARRLDAPQLGRWETDQLHAEAHGMDFERYLPLCSIREKLLSDEAVERGVLAADEIDEGWWNGLSESARNACRAEFCNELIAALAAAFPEQPEQKEGER